MERTMHNVYKNLKTKDIKYINQRYFMYMSL